jgi:hypothetical protein
LAAVTLGIVFLADGTPTDVSGVGNNLSITPNEISIKAIGKHKICALEKMGLWVAMAPTDYAEKAVYSDKVLKPLQTHFSDNVEMLSVHDCVYQGRQFKHVVLRDGANIVSVFVTDSEQPDQDNAPAGTITSEVEDGMQVATFYDRAKTILVVSDLSETQNLSFARTLLNAWKQA